MMGWMLFITLLVLVACFLLEMRAGYGRAFGWGGGGPNTAAVIVSLVILWAVYLLQKFHVIYFWFQVPS